MFAGVDFDFEDAGDAFEVACAGAGGDEDLHFRAGGVHGGEMLEDEAAGFAVEGSGDGLDGDVAGTAFFGIAGGEHFALRGGFEVAMELLVDRHARDAGGGRGGERFDIDCEDAFCVLGHWGGGLGGDESGEAEGGKE